MSNQIENRVVRMEFDNARFEKNIKKTNESLDKFEEKLKLKNANKNFSSTEKNFEKSGKAIEKAGAKMGESFEKAGKSADGSFTKVKNSVSRVQEVVNKFTLDPLNAGVETVKLKFSALQVAAATSVAKITNSVLNAGKKIENSTIGQIKSGGNARSLNIEQARFKIKNLNKDWDALYKDMDYAVSGTAYGIDAAASAAAQLSASGIKAGKEMKYSLRAISGIAAMTGSTYEDIASIFTSAAGKGKVQADELNRISARGISAASALAEQLNKTSKGVKITTADISEMASSGQIDFRTFAKAMDEAFGEGATKANETYTGALSNYKAALSRIGEPFYTAFHDNMKPALVETTKLINKFKNSLMPKDKGVIKKDSIVGVVTQGIEYLRTTYTDLVGNVLKKNNLESFIGSIAKTMNDNFKNFQSVVQSTIRIGSSIIKTFKNIVTPFKDAIHSVFPSQNELGFIATIASKIADIFGTISAAIDNFIHTDKDVQGHAQKNTLTSVFKAIISTGKLAGKVISTVIGWVKKFTVFTNPIVSFVGEKISDIAEHIYNFNTAIMKSKGVKTVIGFISRGLDSLILNLQNLKQWTTPVTDFLKAVWDWLYNKISPVLKNVQNEINKFKSVVYSWMNKRFRTPKLVTVDTIKNALNPASKAVKENTDEMKSDIESVTEESFLLKVFTNIGNFFSSVWSKIQEMKNAITNSDAFGETTNKLKEVFSKIGEIFSTLGNQIKPKFLTSSKSFLEYISNGLDSIIEFVKTHDIIGTVERIAKIFLTGAIGKFIYKRSTSDSFFKGIQGLFKSASDLADAVTKSIAPKKTTIFEKILNNVADILKGFGFMLLSIAASLFIISSIPADRLSDSVAALSAILTFIGLLFAAIYKIADLTQSTSSAKSIRVSKKLVSVKSSDSVFSIISQFIRSIGESILMIAAALKIVSTIGDAGLLTGSVIAIGVIVGLLAVFVSTIISSANELDGTSRRTVTMMLGQMSKFIKKLSSAIVKLAVVMVFLGKALDAKSLIKGSVALGVITLAILSVMWSVGELDDKLLGANKSSKGSTKVVSVISTFTNFITKLSSAFLKMAVAMVVVGRLTNWASWGRGMLTFVAFAVLILLLMHHVKSIDDAVMGKDTISGSRDKTKLSKRVEKLNESSFNKEKTVTKLDKFSKFISTLANAMIKVSVSVAIIGNMTNWASWGRAMITMGAFSGIVFGLAKYSKKIEAPKIDALSNAVLKISASMLIIAIALTKVADISWEGIGKGLISMLAVFSMIAGLGAFASLGKIGSGIVKFGDAIMKIGIGLAAAGFGINQFTKAWERMELLTLTPDVLVNFFSSVFAAIPSILKGFLKSLIDLVITFIIGIIEGVAERMSELITAIGKFLSAFVKAVNDISGKMDMKQVIGALVTVGVVVAMIALLALASKLGKDAIKGIGMMALVVAIMTGMFTVILSLSSGSGVLETAAGLAAAISAIAGLMGTMALIAKFSKGIDNASLWTAFKIFVIAAACVAGILAITGLIAGLVGMLDDSQIKSIKKGLGVIEMIAGGIGRAIGSFVGGVLGSTLAQLGQGLGDFWTKAQPFIKGIQKFNAPSMDAFVKFAKGLAALLGGTIFYGIGKLANNPFSIFQDLFGIKNDGPLLKIGKDLSAFAPYMAEFAKKMGEIKNPDNVAKMCKIIGRCIGDLEKNLPYNVDAFWGFFSMKKMSLKAFGEEMKAFAPSYKSFADVIAKADASDAIVTKCKNIGLMIKNLQENLPWKVKAFWDFWGLKGSVDVHQTPLNKYGEQMSAFSETFVKFANNISGVDDNAFTKAERIATMIATISGSMGTETTAATWLGFFVQHKQSLTNFAHDLNNASTDFGTFITTMGGIKTDGVDLSSVDTIVSIITKFSDFQKDNAEWKPGPLIEFFAGKKETLSDFASNLALAVPNFKTIGTSIANNEWATIKDSQITSVETTMKAIKSFIEALPDDDMRKKIEKWSKIGVNDMNLQNLADVMFGWDKAVYNFDGTRATEWHGNEWVDANKRIPGFIDIISETAKKINKITEITDTTKFTDISTAVNKIFDIIKIFADKDSKIDLNASDTKTKIENFSAWVKATGDGLIEAVSMIKGANQFSQNGKIDKTDFNVFSQVVDAITKVFESWDKFATTTNTNGNLGTAINSALAAISKVVSKFKDFSSDIDKDKAQKVLDWFNVFLKGFGDFDDKKIAKIDKVNTAFANLAGSAFNIAERTELGKDQTGDGGVAYQINKLSTHYNNIILKALDKSQNELKTGYLNSKQIVTEYPLLETLLNKLSGNVDNKKNAFYRKIVAVENAAYDKLYSYTHTNNGHTEDHNFEKIGKYIADGMAFGINTNMQVVRNAANQLGEEAIKAAMKRLREKSPSKEFEKIGMNTTAGYIIGMTSMTAELKKTTTKTFGDTLTTATQTATAQLTKAGKDTANKGFRTFYKNGVKMVEAWAKLEGRSYSPTIAPVVDSSKLDKKYATISTASLALDMDSKSVKQLSSLSASFDAKNEQKIQVDNGDVVKAVNNLDKRFGQLENAIGHMEVKMDGDKTVGAIAPKMNKALGEQFRRSRRGN